MVRLLVNEGERPAGDVPECWGELLDRLQREAAGRGEVVSAVRFDGVEEPTFQRAAQSRRALCSLATIEVETATPRSLLIAALAQGASAAGALASAACDTAAAFRGSSPGAANARLAQVGEGVRSMIAILDAAVALGVAVDAVECSARPAPAPPGDLVGQLHAIVEAQQAHDWLTVADILEYALHPALEAMGRVFEGLLSNAGASRAD